MIEYVVSVVVEVPNAWTPDQVESQRNESSWCEDNAISEIEASVGADNCLCPNMRAKFVREATAEDEKTLGFPSEP